MSVLLCRGPARGWYQRSRILQVQACLRMVLDWARKAGLAHLTDKFLAKFRSAVSILTTPLQQLLQVRPPSSSLAHIAILICNLFRRKCTVCFFMIPPGGIQDSSRSMHNVHHRWRTLRMPWSRFRFSRPIQPSPSGSLIPAGRYRICNASISIWSLQNFLSCGFYSMLHCNKCEAKFPPHWEQRRGFSKRRQTR